MPLFGQRIFREMLAEVAKDVHPDETDAEKVQARSIRRSGFALWQCSAYGVEISGLQDGTHTLGFHRMSLARNPVAPAWNSSELTWSARAVHRCTRSVRPSLCFSGIVGDSLGLRRVGVKPD